MRRNPHEKEGSSAGAGRLRHPAPAELSVPAAVTEAQGNYELPRTLFYNPVTKKDFPALLVELPEAGAAWLKGGEYFQPMLSYAAEVDALVLYQDGAFTLTQIQLSGPSRRSNFYGKRFYHHL